MSWPWSELLRHLISDTHIISTTFIEAFPPIQHCVILLLIVNRTIEVNCPTQFESRPSALFQYCSCVLVDLKLKRENGGNAKKTQKHTGFDVFKEFENFLNSGIWPVTTNQTNANKHLCCLTNVHNTCISPLRRCICSWRNRKQILS